MAESAKVTIEVPGGVGTIVAEPKQFRTGSRGFYGQGKIPAADARTPGSRPTRPPCHPARCRIQDTRPPLAGPVGRLDLHGQLGARHRVVAGPSPPWFPPCFGPKVYAREPRPRLRGDPSRGLVRLTVVPVCGAS